MWLSQSSCHKALPHNANNINVEQGEGGAQAVTMDILWAGRIQKMANANGVPESMKQALEELGINTGTILLNHGNFRTEKTIDENIRIGRGNVFISL